MLVVVEGDMWMEKRDDLYYFQKERKKLVKDRLADPVGKRRFKTRYRLMDEFGNSSISWLRAIFLVCIKLLQLPDPRMTEQNS